MPIIELDHPGSHLWTNIHLEIHGCPLWKIICGWVFHGFSIYVDICQVTGGQLSSPKKWCHCTPRETKQDRNIQWDPGCSWCYWLFVECKRDLPHWDHTSIWTSTCTPHTSHKNLAIKPYTVIIHENTYYICAKCICHYWCLHVCLYFMLFLYIYIYRERCMRMEMDIY